MNLDPNKRRLVYGFATTALVIAGAALWLPTSWQAAVNQQGQWVGTQGCVTHIGLGVLQPLRLTWESGSNGFWLALSRFTRFGPGGTHGVDPVPDIRSVRHTFRPWRYGRWR